MKLTSLLGSFLQLFEAFAYVFGMLAGCFWLVQRLRGSERLPDEIQREGLVILVAIVLIVGISGIVRVVRQRARS